MKTGAKQNTFPVHRNHSRGLRGKTHNLKPETDSKKSGVPITAVALFKASCRCSLASGSGNCTPANEYMDSDEVLDEKLTLLADLLKRSRCTCAYTGAGISKASGIPDYATKAAGSVAAVPEIASPLDAPASFAHHCMVLLHEENLLHYWVQQNHDGLPQKAGFPQERMNEIHGAWFDPSNPVVQFDQSLRHDLFEWMLEQEKLTDALRIS